MGNAYLLILGQVSLLKKLRYRFVALGNPFSCLLEPDAVYSDELLQDFGIWIQIRAFKTSKLVGPGNLFDLRRKLYDFRSQHSFPRAKIQAMRQPQGISENRLLPEYVSRLKERPTSRKP